LPASAPGIARSTGGRAARATHHSMWDRALGYTPDDTKPESLGQRIVAFRRLRGLTQKELARRLGADPSTLARWERGKRQPSAKPLNRLTDLAGVTW